ncbi:MAG: ExeA family protein [Candidatus Binatia bacterium]
MYLEHFNLNEKPFRYLNPNPRFFYYAPQYLSIKQMTDYIVSERNGHIYLYGPIGSGKTTLLKTITEMLSEDDKNIVNFINAPNLKTANALIRRICDGFGVKTHRSYNGTLENFTSWLVEKYEEGSLPVLIIDEAQNIVRDGLRTLHYLMTYVTSEDLLLMIILCGQEELATRVEQFPEIKSRMYPSALSALSRDDTGELVKFRWKVASIDKAKNPLPFTKESLDKIHRHSRGLPREVCKICDQALLTAFADETKKITPEVIDSVAQQLNLSHGK